MIRRPLPASGGEPGNARLTAWTGVLLLGLLLVEVGTLFDLDGLITWHVCVGVLLGPPVLLKIATTGWRMLRYYAGQPAYRRAGPPPPALRVLGPLLVLCTLLVLGTGAALVALGPQAAAAPLLTVGGTGVTALDLHKVAGVSFVPVIAVHVLARVRPALRRTGIGRPRVPGRAARAAVLPLALAAGIVAAVLVLPATGPWTGSPSDQAAGSSAWTTRAARSGSGRSPVISPR